MYVSVPKNYSGIAFARENRVPPEMPLPDMPKAHPPSALPPVKPQPLPEPPCADKDEQEKKPPHTCAECAKQDKNPLTCLLTALRDRGKSGFDTEDFLLLGLIALLLGKEGNEDTVLVLAMLLLI